MYPYAHQELKESFRKYLDLSVLLALLVHALGVIIAPPLRVTPSVQVEEALPVDIFWESPEVPLPPVEVRRPPMPVAALFADIVLSEEAAFEETIRDTDIDIANPVAARIYRADSIDRYRFQYYSEPPAEKRIYKPAFPRLARIAGIEATVVARVFIDERGRVVRVEIEGTPPEIFVAPVVEALMKSEFYPARQREIPVPCTITVPFEFYLR